MVTLRYERRKVAGRAESVQAHVRLRAILVAMTGDGASILDDPIGQLLVSGKASTPSEAERQYLEDHLDDVFALVDSPLYERPGAR